MWFEKLFPGGAIVSAIFAGFILIMPGAYYRLYSAIGSLLFISNVLLCVACSLTTTSRKTELKAKLRAGGKGKLLVSAMSLAVQLLFLTGMLFFFLVMNMGQFVMGIVGMVITSVAIVAAIYGWVAQLKNSDKRISLTEEA